MNQYVKLLTLILQDSEIANFEYWSEFILRIQRDESKRHSALESWFGIHRIPSLFYLRLRAKWWIGEKLQWEEFVRQFPMQGVPPMPAEAPLQAATLMTTLGCRISKVTVATDSALSLTLSDGQRITIEGASEKQEDSWFLELPVEDADRDQWSIVCDSQGVLSGSIPAPANTEHRGNIY